MDRIYITLLCLSLLAFASPFALTAQSSGSKNSNNNHVENGHVIIGTRMPNNIESFRLFKELKLGNGILTFLPEDKQEIMALAKFCRENQIYLNLWEVVYRGSHQVGYGWGKKVPLEKYFSKKEFDSFIDEASPFYLGRYVMGEIGLILYGPQNYEVEWSGTGRAWQNLPSVQTMDEAKRAYTDYVGKHYSFEKRISKGPLINIDAGMTFKYRITPDEFALETMPGDPHLMHACIRGAARAFDKPWGTHIAMHNYGGVSLDPLWQKRWKTSIYYSYISGAQFILKETPPLRYRQIPGDPVRGFHSPEMKHSRQILLEAYQFANIHTRPPEGPMIKIGIVYGNNDGTPGLWNRVAWGQYGDEKWREGPAERSWNLVDKFYRKENWSNETVQGEIDFSGNPPYGQYDVVPVEAPIDQLQQYSALVFLGWNTMTEDIYEKLKKYVANGGHLVMYLPHLNIETDRAKGIKLFRNGDFRDLFGARIYGKGWRKIQGMKCMAASSLKSYHFPKWRISTDPRFIGLYTPARVELSGGHVISGYSDTYRIDRDILESRPVLIENNLGKGTAFLVAVYEFPADEGMIRFSKDLLRTVLQGEQADIRLISSDRIRYAVYKGNLQESKGQYEVIYMLNTDPDVSGLARLWIRGKISKEFILPSNELRLAYLCGDILLIPEQKTVDLAEWKPGKKKDTFRFFSATGQEFDLFNMGDNPHDVSINGKTATCMPGTHVKMNIAKATDPSRAQFFADDFLAEPVVDYDK